MIMNNLKKLRINKRLTQQELCDELQTVGCYITRSAYSRYESGGRNIPCEMIIKFALFFETTTDNILGI